MNNRWAHNLPDELWESIKTRINSQIDIYRFRAVCTTWRSLLPLSSPPPCPLLPPFSSAANSVPLFSSATICRLEPATNHPSILTKVHQSTRGEMQLLIPLSTRQLEPHKHPNNKLNMLNFRLIELAKSYTLKFLIPSLGPSISKVLALPNNPFEILCLLGIGELRYWKSGDPNWTHFDNESYETSPHYDDIILHKGQFYVVDKSGTVSWINTKSFELVTYSPPIYLSGDKKNLVESEGCLYMVDRYIGRERRVGDGRVREMRVYKLDEEWGTWVHVPCLGERVFVLGNDCCFSTSATGLAGCTEVRNCIFFTDSCDEYSGSGFRGISGYLTRVFRLDDRSVRGAACSSGHVCSLSPPPEWISSV